MNANARTDREAVLRLTAPRIAGAYVAVGALWILLSDRLLARLVGHGELFEQIGTAKGWGFVLLTGALIFALVQAMDRQIRAGHGLVAELETQRALELAQSEARYRSLFEHLPTPIWEEDFSAVKTWLDRLRTVGVEDLDGYLDRHAQEIAGSLARVRTIDVNQAAIRLRGATMKQQVLEGAAADASEESLVSHRRELAAIWRGLTSIEYDGAVRTLDGRRRDVAVRWVVAPGHEASLGRVLVTMVDQTQRKRAEAERARVAEELRSARDRIETLLQAVKEVQEARTEAEALRAIAEAVSRSGWAEIAVYSYDNWELVDEAYFGLKEDVIDWLRAHARTPAQRAAMVGQARESYRVSRSYLIPAGSDSPVVEGTRAPVQQVHGAWRTGDVAYVPMFGRSADVVGVISIDDPVDGLRPTEGSFRYLELFADLGARFIQNLRLDAKRHQVERRLRESEERYRILAEQSPSAIMVHQNGRIVYVNRACQTLLGVGNRAGLLGRTALEIVHPDDREHLGERMEWIRRTGLATAVAAQRLLARDGREVEVQAAAAPCVYEGSPAVQIVAHDVSERRAAERALRESEERFRQLAENIDEVFWLLDCETDRIIYMSPAHEKLTGLAPESARGPGGGQRLVHPDDRAHVDSAWRAFRTEGRGPAYEIEHRIVRPDETVRWVRTNAFRVLNDRGEPYRIAGITHDITQEKEAERRQRLMMRELDHRVKNNLSAVLALVEQSLDAFRSLGELRESLTGRIRAMARVHTLLAGGHWKGADLHDVARVVLEAYGKGDQVTIDGPRVELAPQLAAPMCMALHELATNAAKHGALSDPRGRVDVAWTLTRSGTGRVLSVRWTESGGPAVAPGRTGGLGIGLITGAVRHELKGELDLRFEPEGARCVLEVPLPGD